MNENDGVAELVQNGSDTVSFDNGKPLNAAIESLKSKILDLHCRVNIINNLVNDESFKNLSKRNRNELMKGLLNESRDIEEISKVVFRSLKKIKRERISEDAIDSFLGIPENMKAKGDSEESDVEE
jgi:transposase-like protein